jgi:plasmid maintenance system antidote protein VapI
MIDNDVSSVDLAEKIDVHPVSISRMLNRKQGISKRSLISLVNLTNLSVEEVIDSG